MMMGKHAFVAEHSSADLQVLQTMHVTKLMLDTPTLHLPYTIALPHSAVAGSVG